MDSELNSDSAHALAKEIAATPGWQAEASLAMWPSETEPGKYTGSWIVGCTRTEDDYAYMLKSAREWDVLQAKLAAGITPESEKPGPEIHSTGGAICAVHDQPFMPLGWPDKMALPGIGKRISAWACPVCAGTISG